MNKEQVRINKEDRLLLRTKCKEEYIKFNPEFKHLKMSDSFMLNKVIKFYLDN